MRTLVFCAALGAATALFSVETEPTQKAKNDFPLGGDLSLGFDSYRSLPEGSWNGNIGTYGSIHLAYSIPWQHEGAGIQAGGSYGVYDWDGNGATGSKEIQQESFVSAGLFRMTPSCSGVNAGLVYDWQFNGKIGVFGLSPSLAQVRGQIGYLFKGGNEFGFWGSYATRRSNTTYAALPISFRAVSQVNVFWRHIFKKQGELMLWAGTPYQTGLMYSSGRAGTYIAGTSLKAPLTKHLSAEAHGMYMGARSSHAIIESKNYASNISFALTYSFGGVKAGARPYLALANNSNFIVDTNTNY